jgi:hypothetical protein
MMKLKTNILGGLVLVIMFGGIWLTDLMGRWNTGTSKEPSLITTGNAAGRPNPADIRGSYTFGDISKAFGLPVEELGKAFSLPIGTGAAAFQVKGLEALYTTEAAQGKEIGSDSVRYFVALYTSLPFNVNGDIWMPESAVTLLKEHGSLSAEQAQYLEAHSVKTATDGKTPIESTTVPAGSSVPTNGESSSNDKMVSGSTTFQQLLDWGISRETIENIIGGNMPDAGSGIKDYITSQGLEFFSYKQKFQAEVDKLK